MQDAGRSIQVTTGHIAIVIATRNCRTEDWKDSPNDRTLKIRNQHYIHDANTNLPWKTVTRVLNPLYASPPSSSLLSLSPHTAATPGLHSTCETYSWSFNAQDCTNLSRLTILIDLGFDPPDALLATISIKARSRCRIFLHGRGGRVRVPPTWGILHDGPRC